MERTEAVPEEVILEPDRLIWTGGRPLWHHVAATSYWHYAEHLDQIRDVAGVR